MLEIKIGEGSRYSVAVHGDLEEVIVDTMRAVNGIYCSILDVDKEMADAYRVLVHDALTGENSPVWTHKPDRSGVGMLLEKEVQP